MGGRFGDKGLSGIPPVNRVDGEGYTGGPYGVGGNVATPVPTPEQAFKPEPGGSTAHPQFFAPRYSQGIYTGTGKAVQILVSRPKRRYLLIQNQSTTNYIYVGFGVAPSEASGFFINPQGVYEPLYPPGDMIYLFSVASVIAAYIEGY